MVVASSEDLSKTSLPAERKKMVGRVLVFVLFALIVSMIGRRIFAKER